MQEAEKEKKVQNEGNEQEARETAEETTKRAEPNDWLAEILLNATGERRKINSIKLPGEPDFQERPPRVDNTEFQSSVGSLLGQYGGKLEEAEKAKQAETAATGREPTDPAASLRGSNAVHTWSS